ncbi:MAG: cytochrome c biogenesis protein CcsA [bacterium]|nr:cytochrome c biogenesis protein CcsA [bacterium]
MGTQVFIESQRERLADSPDELSDLAWELRLNRWQPFLWAKLLLALSLLIYLFSLRRVWVSLRSGGFAALILGWTLYTLGLTLRAYIAGRAPWSNMYESLLAIGWALVLIAILFEAIRRDRVFAISGAILGALVLGLAQFTSLDRGINPLVPALQSYWLNDHVIITLTGYACFALAMAVGHAVLLAGVRSRGEMTPAIAALAKANLRVVQIGTLFLIAGILLGAVWANVSWGRFWGWDPKETWALICWFVYITFLHGRSAGWLAWRGMAIASVAAFPVVIMTYYGVNYYLSGLHSYGAGSSPGIPRQMFAYLGAEALFLAWAIFKLRGTGRPRPPAEESPETRVSAPASEVAS